MLEGHDPKVIVEMDKEWRLKEPERLAKLARSRESPAEITAITISKQSYLESKVKEDLDLIGVVFGTSVENYERSSCRDFSDESIRRVNENLRKKARESGATYIFGVTYKESNSTMDSSTIGYGDAYKPNGGD